MHRKPLLTEAEDKNVAFGGLFRIEMNAFLSMSSAAKYSQLVWESLSHMGTLNTGISLLSVFSENEQIFLRLTVSMPVLEQVLKVGK